MVLAPNVLQERWNQANALVQARRFAEAEEILATLALSFAGNDAFFSLRGVCARGRGDLQQASEWFRKAARLASQKPDHQFNLGDTLAALGDQAGAVEALRCATSMHARPSVGWLQLAQLLVQLDRGAEAIEELEHLAAAGQNDPPTLKAVAVHALRWGAPDLAGRTAQALLALTPDDLDATAILHKLTADRVPSWHFPMMNDAARNAAYDQAIRRAVRPGMHVLDIGTGAGLLSLMAARAGAGRVTTCEMVPEIAEAAAEIVRRNGYAEQIKVVSKLSMALELGTDLPEPADLLVSEILSSDLLTEDVVTTVADARRRLLKPGARMIPYAVGAVARLVGGPELAQAVSVGTVDGFDLSPFNRFAPGALLAKFSDQAFESLSGDVEVFRFDLANAGAPLPQRTLPFTVSRDGTCIGLLQWIRIYLDEETVFENRPADRFASSGWKLMLYPFPSPRTVAAGQTVRVRAGYSVAGLVFAPMND
jgi:type II protein arginine methyltransferase